MLIDSRFKLLVCSARFWIDFSIKGTVFYRYYSIFQPLSSDPQPGAERCHTFALWHRFTVKPFAHSLRSFIDAIRLQPSVNVNPSPTSTHTP